MPSENDQSPSKALAEVLEQSMASQKNMSNLKKFSAKLENLKKKLKGVVLSNGTSMPKEIPDI